MTPEQLKASILQYAIQGKLVEQRVEEGTGEELYQQIQAEKQRLIQEKKIKRKNRWRRFPKMKFLLIFQKAGSGSRLEMLVHGVQEPHLRGQTPHIMAVSFHG